MIPPIYLIVILSLFVFYAIYVMIKRGDDLHAMAFFTLFVYTIFAQIGYAYFPILSIKAGAYFGAALFYKYWAFMFFSFVFSFAIYQKTIPLNYSKHIYGIKQSDRKYGYFLFLFISFILYAILSLYFRKNRALFGWGGGNPMGSLWFVLGFRIFTICTFFFYVLFRQKTNRSTVLSWSFLLFLMFVIFYLRVAIATGTRSNILYFFIAIMFYELTPLISSIKLQKKKLLIFLITGVFLINLLMILLYLRTHQSNITFSTFVNFKSNVIKTPEKPLYEKILLQDYYPPSHTLFVSMHFHIVDLKETIKSNFANSFVKFNYPLLSQTIVSKIDSRHIERGAGWAYHFFVEGYNAIGWFGVLYNALFWNLGMAFWCALARSNNKEHNRAMLSILVLLIVNAMRGQTCYFVQSFWLLLLPSLGLLLLATNSRILFFNKVENE